MSRGDTCAFNAKPVTRIVKTPTGFLRICADASCLDRIPERNRLNITECFGDRITHANVQPIPRRTP